MCGSLRRRGRGGEERSGSRRCLRFRVLLSNERAGKVGGDPIDAARILFATFGLVHCFVIRDELVFHVRQVSIAEGDRCNVIGVHRVIRENRAAPVLKLYRVVLYGTSTPHRSIQSTVTKQNKRFAVYILMDSEVAATGLCGQLYRHCFSVCVFFDLKQLSRCRTPCEFDSS